MPINLTLKMAQDLIDEAIAERGEGYVYERPYAYSDCKYVHKSTYDAMNDVLVDAEPVAGCAVGLALNKAGISLEVLADHEGLDAETLIKRLYSEDHVHSYDPQAAKFLYFFQDRQDTGSRWGEARADAYRSLQMNAPATSDLM